MSWYDEKRDGPSKLFIEWAFHEEVEPIPDEPGFYRAKKEGGEGLDAV